MYCTKPSLSSPSVISRRPLFLPGSGSWMAGGSVAGRDAMLHFLVNPDGNVHAEESRKIRFFKYPCMHITHVAID